MNENMVGMKQSRLMMVMIGGVLVLVLVVVVVVIKIITHCYVHMCLFNV